jgi:hypothetical protein
MVRRIIGLNRAAAETAASTIFQKYTRGSRPRLAFRDMVYTMGFLDFCGNPGFRARWWRESWYPYYNSSVPPGPHDIFFAHIEGVQRRQFVAGYRRHRRSTLHLLSA